MKYFIIIVPLIFSSCASYHSSDSGFFPSPGMDTDSQDRINTKYNLMDSSDGSNDPNIDATIFKQKF